MTMRLSVLLVVIAVLAGCPDEPAHRPFDDGGSDEGEAEGEGEGGAEGEGEGGDSTACDDLCDGVDASTGIDGDVAASGRAARCYACRCKAAFDGWLPSRDELQCGAGDEVLVYKTTGAGAGDLAVIGDEEDPVSCNNPSLFQDDCGRHARFGTIEHGDVVVRFLCRKLQYGGVGAGGSYDLAGIIGANARTGETCFWDAALPPGDDDMPDLDITASAAEAEAFAGTFYRTYGESCIGCHDNDPFIYTPYLKSVPWKTGPYTTAPYMQVQLNGPSLPTGIRHLRETPAVQQCTACHRLSESQTCAVFTHDALGDFVEDPGLGIVAPHDFEESAFAHALWMPSDGVARTEEEWHAELDDVRDTILSCCSAPGLDTYDADDNPVCAWDL